MLLKMCCHMTNDVQYQLDKSRSKLAPVGLKIETSVDILLTALFKDKNTT